MLRNDTVSTPRKQMGKSNDNYANEPKQFAAVEMQYVSDITY